MEPPSSSNSGAVSAFVKSIIGLKEKAGLLQRWHQVAFQRELLLRSSDDSVRKVRLLQRGPDRGP